VQFSGDVTMLKRETRQPTIEDAIATLMRETLAA